MASGTFSFKASVAVMDPIWVGLGSQLGSRNPSNRSKNRCQETLYVGLQIFIDFESIWAPNLDPLILENPGFFQKVRFALEMIKSTRRNRIYLCDFLEFLFNFQSRSRMGRYDL